MIHSSKDEFSTIQSEPRFLHLHVFIASMPDADEQISLRKEQPLQMGNLWHEVTTTEPKLLLPEEEAPILIIGAGLVGLTLAQSLRKDNIPFRIFERDTHIDARAPGWAVTIHWALSALQSCLLDHIFQKLKTCQVDPTISGPTDTGRFLFLDLVTAEPRYVIPPAPRLRLNRRKFREVLCEGLDVHWGKEMINFKMHGSLVEVAFKDGSTTQGRMLIGADGSNSRTRQLMCPETWKLEQLPVKLIGVTVRLTEGEVMPLRAIDPLLFQGCCGLTGTFMWFSILSTPTVNNSNGSTTPYYEAQINLSWKVDGVQVAGGGEVPKTNEERLEKMKALAQSFDSRLRTLIESIPSDTPVLEIKVQDWPSVFWPNKQNCKVTLIGDAAHAMSMYRGEGLNHGITDAQQLHSALLSIYKREVEEEERIMAFETQMRERTRNAVLLSREACLDAHDLDALRDESPLVSKRAVVRTKAMALYPGVTES